MLITPLPSFPVWVGGADQGARKMEGRTSAKSNHDFELGEPPPFLVGWILAPPAPNFRSSS